MTVEPQRARTLQQEIALREVPYTTFAEANEQMRKRILKSDYQSLKDTHGWKYDQPILPQAVQLPA